MSVGTEESKEIDLTIDLTDGELSDNDAQLEEGRTETVMNTNCIRIGLCELLRCSICAAEFAGKDDLWSHMSVHSEHLPFKCALCDERYSSQDELSAHMSVHASAPYHTCEVCNVNFTTITGLRKHKMIHDTATHKCNICGKVCRSERGLASHAAVHNQLKCQSSSTERESAVIDSDFSSNDAMAPTAEVIYECIVCGEGYTDKEDLNYHMIEHNVSLGQDSVFLNETDINLPREMQDVTIRTNQPIDLTDGITDHSEGYTSQIDVQNHSAVHVIEPCDSSSEDDLDDTSKTSNVKYQSLLTSDSSSDEGGARFDKDSNLHTMLTDQAPDEGFVVPVDNPGDVIDLTDEVPTQSRKQEYDSDETDDELIDGGMGYEYESPFNGMQAGSKEHPYKCNICGRELVSRRSLREHMNVHTNKGPHRCTICGKGFLRQSNMSRHMMLHTGERPYKCSLCGHDFIRENALKRHMLRHSGKMPFECEECGKGFLANYLLINHARCHTGEKPYHCRICGKAFRLKWSVTSHELTHTGSRPHKCSICSKRFLRKGDMKKHTKLHDNNRL